MKSFSQWLIEDKTMGNYVCIDSEDQSKYFKTVGIKPPNTGVTPPKGDYHCTLMYSESSNIWPHKILSDLENKFPNAIIADIIGFECFDSTSGESKSCIVMKVSNPLLNEIHQWLKINGLSHSYDQFQPHVTLRYNMDIAEAHKYKEKLNNELSLNKRTIVLSGYKSDKIDTNYV